MKDENEFLDFAAGVMRAGRADVSLETAYGSIPQWDSVMHLRLTLEIGERYGADIPLEAVPEIKTLGDFFGFVPERA